MQSTANQNLVLIEGAATYERIMADVREVEIDEGIRHIRDFIKIYPDFAPAHNDLAVMYYQTDNRLKALAHYEKAHKLDPRNVTYRKNLADFYFVELEWTGDAINSYLGILKDNPFDVEALNALGTISLQIGRKEQARQYFTRTLQIDADNQDARYALRQLPEALPAPAAPRQLSHHSPRPVERQAEPIVAAPAAEPFQNLFREAPPVPKRSAAELHREAAVLSSNGKIDEAIRLLESLLEQDAEHAVAHNDLGVLHQKSGNRQASRRHHETAVKLQPSNKIFQKNLADLLYIEFHDLEEALNIYVRLQAKSPQDIEILKAIASICQLFDKTTDARYFLQRVLALQPWDREAQEMLKNLEEPAGNRA